jgi:hypothetical protein
MLPELQATKRLLEPELVKLAKALGFSLRIGRSVYTNDTFVIKIEGGRVVKGAVMDRHAEYLKANEGWLGVKYGQMIFIRGRMYKVTGYNSRARTRPVCIEDSNGKKLIAPMSLVNPNAR